jgi:hypothetical protein
VRGEADITWLHKTKRLDDDDQGRTAPIRRALAPVGIFYSRHACLDIRGGVLLHCEAWS